MRPFNLLILTLFSLSLHAKDLISPEDGRALTEISANFLEVLGGASLVLKGVYPKTVLEVVRAEKALKETKKIPKNRGRVQAFNAAERELSFARAKLFKESTYLSKLFRVAGVVGGALLIVDYIGRSYLLYDEIENIFDIRRPDLHFIPLSFYPEFFNRAIEPIKESISADEFEKYFNEHGGR